MGNTILYLNSDRTNVLNIGKMTFKTVNNLGLLDSANAGQTATDIVLNLKNGDYNTAKRVIESFNTTGVISDDEFGYAIQNYTEDKVKEGMTELEALNDFFDMLLDKLKQSGFFAKALQSILDIGESEFHMNYLMENSEPSEVEAFKYTLTVIQDFLK